jgi:predicted secreted Zn-dependent protease
MKDKQATCHMKVIAITNYDLKLQRHLLPSKLFCYIKNLYSRLIISVKLAA